MVYVAFVLSLIKLLLDLFVYSVKAINLRQKQKNSLEGVTCKYIQTGENGDECTHILFKRKMQDGTCPREHCWGFISDSELKEEIPIISSPFFLIIKKAVDLFPEFSVALLALCEIMK